MKIVTKHNVDGANIYVRIHVNEKTEASIYDSPGYADASTLNIGNVTIFASDADLTILASAIGDHIRNKYMRPKL